MANALLEHACRIGDTAEFLHLLNTEGADPLHVSKEGFSLFHLASKLGFLCIVKYYLSNKHFPVDTPGPSFGGNRTALYYAVANKRSDIAAALLDAGADPDACERYFGFTCVHEAMRQRDVNMVRVLLSRSSCDSNKRDRFGNNALFWAREYGVLDQVKIYFGDEQVTRFASIEEKYYYYCTERKKRGLPFTDLKLHHKVRHGHKTKKSNKKAKK